MFQILLSEFLFAVPLAAAAGAIRGAVFLALSRQPSLRAGVLHTCSIVFWLALLIAFVTALTVEDRLPGVVGLPLEIAGLALLARGIHAFSVGRQLRLDRK